LGRLYLRAAYAENVSDVNVLLEHAFHRQDFRF